VTGATKTIFVSSVAYHATLGGLSGADAKCQSLATAAGLSGTYKAWLSDDTSSAASRLSHSTGPYALVDGTVVAANWAGLTSGTLQNGISKTESGGSPPQTYLFACVTNTTLAWTGTKADGTNLVSSNCSNWNGLSGGAVLGLPAWTNSAWTDECEMPAAAITCEGTAVLYCIEQ
jgi:hypothetical protein